MDVLKTVYNFTNYNISNSTDRLAAAAIPMNSVFNFINNSYVFYKFT